MWSAGPRDQGRSEVFHDPPINANNPAAAGDTCVFVTRGQMGNCKNCSAPSSVAQNFSQIGSSTRCLLLGPALTQDSPLICCSLEGDWVGSLQEVFESSGIRGNDC